ncbi:MAG: flagellar basal body P-ring protein FlgI, partial [Planctomycetota bacterium]
MTVPTLPDRVGDAIVARGMNSLHVTGVGLVTKLDGRGGSPDPSTYRDELVEIMKRHDIAAPKVLLESTNNALVRIRASIPPGARRGDRIDVAVESPVDANANDLSNGWLLEARLALQTRVKGSLGRTEVKGGKTAAIAKGPVLSRTQHTVYSDDSNGRSGHVIGGAIVQEDREISLKIGESYAHKHNAEKLAKAINQRFKFFDGISREGIAKPTRDDSIELRLHPRYHHNPSR